MEAMLFYIVSFAKEFVLDCALRFPYIDPRGFLVSWEEEEVRFGPGSQGQGACGHEGLIAKLRHARRAVDPASRPQ